MKRKLISLFVLFILLSTAIISNSSCSAISRNSQLCNGEKTIYVDDDNTQGPWNGTLEYPYQYIHDAVENATHGDTIYVFNGTYNETVIIDKTLSIIGEDKNTTIIDGMYNDSIVHITEDYVSIYNFTIRNSGEYTDNAGIKLDSENNLIVECIFYRTKTGIYVNEGDYNEINNCTIHNNGQGVHIKSSDSNVIEGCTLGHNSIGIHFENSFDNLIKYSYLHTNGRACFINNSRSIEMFHCNISDNSVNHGGVFIRRCSDVNITNSILCHNGAAVSIAESYSISILNSNLCGNTHFAVWMEKSCYDVKVFSCEISNNFRFGIYVVEDSFCTISNNNIYGNMLYGLYSKNSHCKSRNNYWGSPFGPSFTDLRKSSRISLTFAKIQYIPWLLKPLHEIGADWRDNEDYMNSEFNYSNKRHIDLPGVDTDEDGVPDWWEEKWGYNPDYWDDHSNLDPDEDGLNNIEECYTDPYNSNPFYKDIFLEIDWVESQSQESNKPEEEMINRAINVFKEHEINLHVDVGDLDGGEEIPYATNFSFPYLCELYWNYFLHNNLNNPRKGIFHYGIICDYGPDVNFPFMGWNHLDSFLISVEILKKKVPQYSRSCLIMGGAVHHLGHTLGLLADTYGGIDNLGIVPFTIQWLKYRNYKSCMNYYYKYKLFSYSDGLHGFGDFDDWNNLDFSFFKNSHFEWPRFEII